MLTEKEQEKIVRKAFGNTKGMFIAVITEDKHPENAKEVELNGVKYYVTLKFGDFCCIFIN